MQHPENDKDKQSSPTVDKKEATRTHERALNRQHSLVSIENEEYINDILRFAVGQERTWKIVAKDSCEIYRNQRNKQDTTKADKEKTNRKTTDKRSSSRRKTSRGTSKRGRSTSDDDRRGKQVRSSKKSKRDRNMSAEDSHSSRKKYARSSKRAKKTTKKRKQYK